MLTDDEIETLHGIFYEEAPYDYILSIEIRKKKYYRGACYYQEKICRLFGPDNYMSALMTMLHELAHARIQHKTHSDIWEKEFVRLLAKYKYPKNLAENHVIGPNLRAYIQS